MMARKASHGIRSIRMRDKAVALGPMSEQRVVIEEDLLSDAAAKGLKIPASDL